MPEIRPVVNTQKAQKYFDVSYYDIKTSPCDFFKNFYLS